jgi:ferredoxin
VRITLGIIFLAGFILLFSDVKAKLPSEIYLFFTSFQFLPSLLKFMHLPGIITLGFLLIILVTILSGRVYCSVFCPLGIMQDAIAYMRRKIPFKRQRRKYRKSLNYLRYPILALFIVSLFFFGLLSINWLDPYANFGRMAADIYQPVFIFANNLVSKVLTSIGIYSIQPLVMKVFSPVAFFSGLTMFFLILVMVIYRDRLYCNTVCPVGTILGLLSRISFLKIRINKTSCTQCGNCQVACKANCISIKEMSVDESRCVSCFNCINSCEDSAIGYTNVWVKPERSLYQTDSSKRDFLRAGLVFMGAYPLLAKAEEDEEQEHKACFWSRGPISPPGSQSIDHLRSNCIGCQLCVASCPTKVLQPAFLEYGFTGMNLPRMDNKVGFCNFECTKCGEVCPTGAILPLAKTEKETIQIGTVQFRKHLCIVESEGTACGSCSEHCPTQAVYMVPYLDDLTIPEINPNICVGCGACEHACPVTDPHVAIFVTPNKVHQVAEKPVSEELEVEETEDFPF